MDIPQRAEIRRKGDSDGWDLFLDGVQFPWPIEREAAEVVNLAPGFSRPVYSLRIGILVDSIVGAEEFNEFLDEEADRYRVRSADHRDSLELQC